MGVVGVVTMVIHNGWHESDPVLKYLLVSIGTSLVLVVSLLMCSKGKGKKSEVKKEKEK